MASKPTGNHQVGRPRKFRSAAEFLKKANEYFESNTEYYITSFVLHMGLTCIQNLHEYAARPEFSDVVNACRTKIQANIEPKLYQKTSASGAQFFMRAQAGWKIQDQLDVTSGGKEMAAATVNLTFRELDTCKPEVE